MENKFISSYFVYFYKGCIYTFKSNELPGSNGCKIEFKVEDPTVCWCEDWRWTYASKKNELIQDNSFDPLDQFVASIVWPKANFNDGKEK